MGQDHPVELFAAGHCGQQLSQWLQEHNEKPVMVKYNGLTKAPSPAMSAGPPHWSAALLHCHMLVALMILKRRCTTIQEECVMRLEADVHGKLWPQGPNRDPELISASAQHSIRLHSCLRSVSGHAAAGSVAQLRKTTTASMTQWDRCLLSKSTNNTKLGGVADTPEGCAALQKPFRWTEKNWLKFDKDKCRVLQLGKNNPLHQYRLGTDLLESSSAEKDLGDLVDNKPSMSQQCVLIDKKANAQKANQILACIKCRVASRSKEVSYSCETLPAVLCTVLVLPTKGGYGIVGASPEEDHKVGASHIFA
ncbi:hypothetical protein WISP_146572 [Willisornis vidua]|uniref:Uncharacterized protein n=1 Tax=Willisornis vidua TaxID=1566151 RepID=A0ABQ9CQE4_9PASS|nr:hypothetical protein WISP_146572 [Willisornis vidua]